MSVIAYPLYNIFKINDLWHIIILTIPIILEPLILLANIPYLDNKKKINIKFILVVAILISILAIYTIIRQSMEFGLLIETISFPYFESGKFMSIKSNFDNIDYYYLFLITIALFSRLPMLYFNIKDSFKIKAKGIFILILITLIIHYYIQKKLEFYKEIIIPSLMLCSIILLILLIMNVFSKRSQKNAK